MRLGKVSHSLKTLRSKVSELKDHDCYTIWTGLKRLLLAQSSGVVDTDRGGEGIPDWEGLPEIF